MQGVSANTIRLRIKRLTQRVMGQSYICFVRQERRFSSGQMALAYDRYILGLGYRAMARKHGLGEWSVRRQIHKLQRWLEQQ